MSPASRSLRPGAERTAHASRQRAGSSDPSSRVSAFEQPLGPHGSKGLAPIGRANRLSSRAQVEPEERPIMPLYEHVFMARQDVTSQQVETMVDQYKGVIESAGGKVEKTEMWGVKSLAYRIKKNRKAHFTMFNLDAPPAAVAEMERQMRINEDVLRFITVRVDELETEPSVMMQKRDRDERKDRERGRRRDDEGGYEGGGDAAPPPAAAQEA